MFKFVKLISLVVTHSDNFESTSERCRFSVVTEDFFGGVVAGNYDSLWSGFNGCTFGFGIKGVMVCPPEYMGAKDRVLFCKIIENDKSLTTVAVPPFV